MIRCGGLAMLLTVVMVAGGPAISSAQDTEAPADTVSFRLNLQPPRQFTVRFNQAVQSVEKIGRLEQKTVVNNSTTFAVKVAGVHPDGSMALDVFVQAFSADVDTPLLTGRVDTTAPSPDTPSLLKHWLALPGNGFRITITPEGKVRSVEGADIIQQRLVAAIDPESIPMKPILENEIKNSYSDKALTQFWENMFTYMPTEPQRIGGQWSRTDNEDEGPLARQSTTQYVLRGRQQGFSQVDYTSTYQPHPNPPAVENMPGIRFRPSVTGGNQGQVTVHEATGWPVRMSSRARFENTVRIENPPAGVPAEIPATIDIVAQIETSG